MGDLLSSVSLEVGTGGPGTLPTHFMLGRPPVSSVGHGFAGWRVGAQVHGAPRVQGGWWAVLGARPSGDWDSGGSASGLAARTLSKCGLMPTLRSEAAAPHPWFWRQFILDPGSPCALLSAS